MLGQEENHLVEKGSGNAASCLAEFSICRWGPGTGRSHVDPPCGACVWLYLLLGLLLRAIGSGQAAFQSLCVCV